MANYERMDSAWVQRLAKSGDKDALYEMAWRIDLLPLEHREDKVECCAWQDYWFEKAANAGHIEAKSRYARSLIGRVIDAEYRQKAMGYFQSLVEDFDAGRLSKDQEVDGILAKYWLGVMLCEGYHTKRDTVMGAELIKSAELLSRGFEGFGFRFMYTLGELYAQGLAQPGEEPSVADLEQSIKYFESAIRRFNPEKDDPNNRGRLELTRQLFETQKRRIVAKMSSGDTGPCFPGAGEQRKKMMEVSDEGQLRLKADKAALERLRQRLVQESL